MITFLGDVALIEDKMASEYKPESPYVFNFEYVYGNKKEYTPVINKINLSSENIDFAEIFGKAPIAVDVVNNHIYDYGTLGYVKTVSKIREENIIPLDTKPCYITSDLLILSYTALNQDSELEFRQEKVSQIIKSARQNNSQVRIVVQMHWGIENHPKQNARQTQIAHWLIDQGVDLVIGHHPHCLQPVEQYKGKYIFYSLGNALFGEINQPSHFDDKGNAKRKYRFKWQKWNRKSMAVVYDERANTIVDELYQKKNTLKYKKSVTNLTFFTKNCEPFWADVLYLIRKYYLFFISNAFTDGKIFDIQALKNEMRRR